MPNKNNPKRKRKHNNNSSIHNELYKNTTFQKRPSSGRPASPHRFFEASYDVYFSYDDNQHYTDINTLEDNDCSNAAAGNVDAATSDGNQAESLEKNRIKETQYEVIENDAASPSPTAKKIPAQNDATNNAEGKNDNETEKKKTIIEATTTNNAKHNNINNPNNKKNEKIITLKHQVVHHHLNGLCIITAGTTINNLISSLLDAPLHDKDSNNNNSINADTNETKYKNKISKFEYNVKPNADVQSVGGKRRTTKKHAKKTTPSTKKKKEDGIIEPMDTIATMTLCNGTQIQFLGCVAGTIVELNARLLMMGYSKGDEGEGERKEKVESSSNDGDDKAEECNTSLLLTDPLLDGYLAVVLPTGPFPPSPSSSLPLSCTKTD